MTAHRHKNSAGKWVTVSDGKHVHSEYATKIAALEARVTALEGPVEPPPPPPPPVGELVFSNIATSEITGTSAVVSWNVAPAATGQIEYGITTAYGSLSALETSELAFHSQRLSGLAPGTTYHFRIKGTTAGGASAVSADGTIVS